jgi:hypothetical protein
VCASHWAQVELPARYRPVWLRWRLDSVSTIVSCFHSGPYRAAHCPIILNLRPNSTSSNLLVRGSYGGVGVYIHVFLTSALNGGELSASRPDRFTPAERAPGTHWIGGWVTPRTGLDDEMRIEILFVELGNCSPRFSKK